MLSYFKKIGRQARKTKKRMASKQNDQPLVHPLPPANSAVPVVNGVSEIGVSYSEKVKPITTRGGIYSLPDDALISLLAFLDPEDILSFRRCCKIFLFVSKERSVWLNALRRMCSLRGGYVHTYPLNDMSLSQLEHAATSPSRFANRFRRKTRLGNTIGYAASQVIHINRSIPETLKTEDTCFEHLSIVPGGRFLVTMSVWRSSTNFLQLWDLGFNAHMAINSQPIASLTLGTNVIHYKPETQIAPDGQGLLVVVSEMWPVAINRSRRKFRIFRIQTNESNPTFHEMPSLQLEVGSRVTCTFCFTPTQLVYHFEKQLLVWNFVEDTWISWETGPLVEDLSISDSHVVLLHPNEFAVWKIPPLEPRNVNDDVEPMVIDHEPILRHPHGVSSSSTTDSMKITLSPVWYASISPSTSPFVHFDLLHDFEAGGCVTRYLAKYEANSADGTLTYVPRKVETSRLEQLQFVNTALSIRSGGEDFYLMWWNDTEVYMHLSTLSRTKEDVSESQTIPMRLSVPVRHDAKYGQVVSCPVSGRICSLASDKVKFHVMDFLRPANDSPEALSDRLQQLSL